MKIKMKYSILLLIFVASLSSATNVVRGQDQFNPRPINFNLTAEQWREDLRYFADELPKRHRNAFHSVSRAQFETAVKTLDANIPKLNNEEIFVGFIRIMAMLGDGHSSIAPAR